MGPVRRQTREIQEIENSGNEAKKYLKTKKVTFFNVAQSVRFARNLAQFKRQKEQKQRI